MKGHDALPRWEDRHQTRTTKSVKDKELTDLLDGVKAVDQMYCDTPELPTRFVAVNLLDVPSCKPNGSNDDDLTHRVRSLEKQMNEVLSMKLNYANVANPPAHIQNTPKRVVPGQSIPVTDPHYLPLGSRLRKKQPLGPYLDRSKSVEEAIDRTVDDLTTILLVMSLLCLKTVLMMIILRSLFIVKDATTTMQCSTEEE